jgi:ERF superfamily
MENSMTTENQNDLIAALVIAKGNFEPIKKDKQGARSKYASLDSVLTAIEPALLKEGIFISHRISEGRLVTELLHIGGGSLASEIELPKVADPQTIGGHITYYRRYLICGLLSICADEDDDGQDAKSYAASKPKNGYNIGPLPTLEPGKKVDLIAQRRADCATYFQEMGWTIKAQKEWAATISDKPSTDWDITLWDRALKALSIEATSLAKTN